MATLAYTIHLFLAAIMVISANPGCRIDISTDLNHVSRMLLHPYSTSTDGYRFILPSGGEGTVSLMPQQELAFACPLGGLYEHARCVSGTTFQFSSPDRQLNISEIICRRAMKATVRVLGKCSNTELNHLGVGVMLRANSSAHEFIKLIDFCFNPTLRTPQYAKYTLMQGAQKGQRIAKKQNFTCSNFFANLSKEFEDIFSRRNQYLKLTELLGSSNLTDQYLNRSQNSDLYLTKGHLVSFAGFVYYPQQQATIICANIVPIWQVLRKNNWRNLEISIRQYAGLQGKDLTVYSGTFNVLHLTNLTGERIPVYLATDVDGRSAVPVPELFWKLVYDRLMRQGIVFLLINNHVSNIDPTQYEVCQDVCNLTESWFQTWDRKQINKGYIYCCRINEFLHATNAIPGFRDVVTGLLT